MKKNIIKQLNKLNKKEQKIINKQEIRIIREKFNPYVNKLESKIPDSVKTSLNAAFFKAFQIVFEKGSKYIEKTYNKEKIQLEHTLNDYSIDKNLSVKNIREMDRYAQKSKLFNTSVSTVEGAGLGLLGMGLPDIPLFTAMILKTIYEIGLSYGFLYELEDEKIYILNIISAALTKGPEQIKHNDTVDEVGYKIDNHIPLGYNINDVIKEASEILSDSLLTAKFVQGIPLVGVIGGITNYTVINKISKYSAIKYKKRYLNNKI